MKMESLEHEQQPDHVASLERVRQLVATATFGEALKNAVLEASSNVKLFDPPEHLRTILELSEHAKRIKTYTEYRPGHEYNSSAGVATAILQEAFLLPGITDSTPNKLTLHFARMKALGGYALCLPVYERKLGGRFYETARDINIQQREHARAIVRLTSSRRYLSTYQRFYRMEAAAILSRMVDVQVNPRYL